MELPNVRSKILGIVAVGLIAWSATLWIVWISAPLTDEVGVIVDQPVASADGEVTGATAPVQTRTVVAVCGKVWQSTVGPTEALPNLLEGERYDHAPCERLHHDNRIVLGLNAVVVLVGLLAVVVLAPGRIRRGGSADELAALDRPATA